MPTVAAGTPAPLNIVLTVSDALPAANAGD